MFKLRTKNGGGPGGERASGSKNPSPTKTPLKRNSKLITQTSLVGLQTLQTFNKWLQRFKQICYDINWEVREQVASKFAFVVQNLGILRGCQDVNHIMKELEDLIDDEEEDVVCASLESACEVVGFINTELREDWVHAEKYT
jgi:hypothetical protein